jgi:hypothetical protein
MPNPRGFVLLKTSISHCSFKRPINSNARLKDKVPVFDNSVCVCEVAFPKHARPLREANEALTPITAVTRHTNGARGEASEKLVLSGEPSVLSSKLRQIPSASVWGGMTETWGGSGSGSVAWYDLAPLAVRPYTRGRDYLC